MFAFTLHSEYTTSCLIAKSVVRHNFQSSSKKQARQTFHCFVLNSHFIQPSECKYVLFVCLSECKCLLFPCISVTLAGNFLSAQLIYRRRFKLCHPFYYFRGKESKLFFADVANRKKINPHVFLGKTTKIWRRENIPLYGTQHLYQISKSLAQ